MTWFNFNNVFGGCNGELCPKCPPFCATNCPAIDATRLFIHAGSSGHPWCAQVGVNNHPFLNGNYPMAHVGPMFFTGQIPVDPGTGCTYATLNFGCLGSPVDIGEPIVFGVGISLNGNCLVFDIQNSN